MKPSSDNFPCNSCSLRSHCKEACDRLNDYLDNDPNCHTRSKRCVETPLEHPVLEYLAEKVQMSGSQTWQEIASAGITEADVDEIEWLDTGDKHISKLLWAEKIVHKIIAKQLRISRRSVKRHKQRIKKKLVKIRED